MGIPSAPITIRDGGLGVIRPNSAGVQVKVGVCSKGTPNTIYSFSDVKAMVKALGHGPLVEAAGQVLDIAGGPVYLCPINPSVAGAATSGAHTGTGVGTVTPTVAPDRTISVKITTGGAIATMAFSVSVDGGAYGTPVVTTGSAPFVYAVPGTLTTLTFAAGTYVLNDVYAVATTGVVTRTGSGPSGVVTQASSPVDAYDILITVSKGGTLGAATFTYSLDGGRTVSPSILVPGGGVYVIPGTGVVLTFAGGAGAFVLDDTYTITTTTAGFVAGDVTNAFNAVLGSSKSFGFIHLIGEASSAAGSATIAGVVGALLTAAETAFRYVWAIVECPWDASVNNDAACTTAFASFSHARVMVCVGQAEMYSRISVRTGKRNAAWAVSARASAVKASEDLGYIGRGALKNVLSLYRDEGVTEALDDQRFTTLRTHIGKEGYFITQGRMMAAAGSDFWIVQNRRVMDRACEITRDATLEYLNAEVRVELEDESRKGYIDERDAQIFESDCLAKLRDAILGPGLASGVEVVMNRTTNILATGEAPVEISVIPKAYLKKISTSIGFVNPAAG